MQQKPRSESPASTALVFLLSLSAVLFPGLYDGFLSLAAALTGFVLCSRSLLNQSGAWSLPFVTLLLGSAIAFGLYSIDPVVIWRGFAASCQQESCSSFIPVSMHLLGSQLRPLKIYLPLFSFFSLLALLIEAPAIRRRYHEYLVQAGILSAAVMFMLYGGLLPELHGSQWEYWEAQNRFAGIFTDPNALGVCSYLLAALSFMLWREQRRGLYFVAILAWMMFGAVSGSRSFFLGLSVSFLVYLFYAHRRMLAAVVLLGVGLILTLRNMPADTITYLGQGLPVGAERVLSSVTSSEGFFSRKVFWHVAMHLWREDPIFGIGLGQFLRSFPHASESLGYVLHGWTDNSNSFYLQILVEYGLLGITALFVSIIPVRCRPAALLELSVLAGFLVQLVFGPHLQFTEVALVAPAVLAPALTFSSYPTALYRRLGMLFFTAAFLPLFLVPGRLNRGIIREDDATFWVVREAALTIRCHAPEVILNLATPYSSPTPLVVDVMAGAGRSSSLSLPTSATLPVTASCPEDRTLRIQFACSRFWLPHLMHQMDDVRPRCVQVHIKGGELG